MICVDCGNNIPGFNQYTDEKDVCDVCLCKRLGIEASSYDEAEQKLDELGEVDYELDKWVCTRIGSRGM